MLSGADTVATFDLQGNGGSPTVNLLRVVVRAGQVELKGSGWVTSEADHATAKVVVSGPLACAQLAGSVARQSFGGLFGDIAADVARNAFAGNPVVTVTIDGDSRDLGATKLVPSVGVGCRLSLPGVAP